MLQEILQLLRDNEFGRASSLATQALRDAAAQSSQRLEEVARELVGFRGFFKNTTEAKLAEPYFRTLHAFLGQTAGPDSPVTIAAAENLAGLLASLDNIEEAIVLRERVLRNLSARLPNDDSRISTVRDTLSILYQRAGREDDLKRLYAHTGLCEHLQPAERYLRDHGGRIVSSGQPWSDNCHVWVYFDTVLDCSGLIEGLHLDPCVHVHEHRGTHDGSERGIVCTIHHDGIMGRLREDQAASL
jgi:hypothetical protein